MHTDTEVRLPVVHELLLARLGALHRVEQLGWEGGGGELQVERDVRTGQHAESARLDIEGEEGVGDDLAVEAAGGEERLVEGVLDGEGVVEGGRSGGRYALVEQGVAGDRVGGGGQAESGEEPDEPEEQRDPGAEAG